MSLLQRQRLCKPDKLSVINKTGSSPLASTLNLFLQGSCSDRHTERSPTERQILKASWFGSLRTRPVTKMWGRGTQKTVIKWFSDKGWENSERCHQANHPSAQWDSTLRESHVELCGTFTSELTNCTGTGLESLKATGWRVFLAGESVASAQAQI